MPLRPAAGKHEPPSSPRQDQQQHTHTHARTPTRPYTHAPNGSQGASTDSSSSREEESSVPVPHAVPAFGPGGEHSNSAGAPMEEPTGNTVVIRIGIPDLQQTVRAFCVATAGECKREGRCLSPFFAVGLLLSCVLCLVGWRLLSFSLSFHFIFLRYFFSLFCLVLSLSFWFQYSDFVALVACWLLGVPHPPACPTGSSLIKVPLYKWASADFDN